ncbi:isoleucine-tRNA ligase [Tieghemiomyces parasiticus]|uniref:Isoleucine--tRNA ligase, mitochondrial n=1 Tax=Tieghemiomyces parasiticus TaxID=78921 RepID=A0A9W8AGI9_9FUNG|nr:isoleucine-tRNA ligase [Tieghemiomyces parasiticus]
MLLCGRLASRASRLPIATGARSHYSRHASTGNSKVYNQTLRLPQTDFPQRPQRPANYAATSRHLADQIYAWQLANNPGPQFILHDGPPYANGDLHLGHALNRITKDIINRYQVLRGRRVRYIPGWDCHGLPIELKALAKLGTANGKAPATDAGDGAAASLDPLKIRRVARKTALTTLEAQKRELQEWGVLADWDVVYRTLDLDYEVRQLGVFRTMVEKGLIYRRTRPVYWSPSSRTALAEAELEYKADHRSQSAYVRFPMTVDATLAKRLGVQLQTLHNRPVYALIWTTTPWTLPANRAIAVHPEIEYVLVDPTSSGHDGSTTPQTGDTGPGPLYIVAKARLADLSAKLGLPADAPGSTTVAGSHLVGLTYLHPLNETILPVIAASYVTADSGTGLVHTAPGHGLEDYEACLALGIPAYAPVDDRGCFTAEAGPALIGKPVLTEGNRAVLDLLTAAGALLHRETIVHSYPYDWRSKQPVIQRATPQWFANLHSIQTPAIRALDAVAALPASSITRLQGYVAGRKEWCISRQRAWGVPIPVLYNEATGEALCTAATIDHIIGVLQERGTDAWWYGSVADFIPPAYRNDGQTYRRGTDTMDVWFDSGTSWTLLEAFRPPADQDPQPLADLYLEGSDQHRGWFQSSLLTAIATTGRAPFRKLVTHGFTLDAEGRKMSKSLGNVIDPRTVVQGGADRRRQPALGIDGLRLWVASTEYTKDVTVSDQALVTVGDTLRKFRNTARFMLGNLETGTVGETNEVITDVDRYALLELNDFLAQATAAYDALAFNKVYQHLARFTNAFLSAFYFDITKDRLYAEAPASSRRRSTQVVLHHLLRGYASVLAPLTIHLAEEIHHHHQKRVSEPSPSPVPASTVETADSSVAKPASVYAQPWPTPNPEWENSSLRHTWRALLPVRDEAMLALERARQEKHIGRSLDADLVFYISEGPLAAQCREAGRLFNMVPDDLAEVFIVSNVHLTTDPAEWRRGQSEGAYLAVGNTVPVNYPVAPHHGVVEGTVQVAVRQATKHKCPRCWRLCSAGVDALCPRCREVVGGIEDAATA